MENLIQYNSILYGFTDYGDDKRIMAFKDGQYKESLSDSSFSTGEKVYKFAAYKKYLYALVVTSSSSRLLKLDVLNTGEEDTWTEVLSTSELTEQCKDLNYYNDDLIIVGDTVLWYFDGTTLTSGDSLPATYDVYASLYLDNYLYLYGNDGTNDALYKYDGSTFTLIDSSDNPYPFSTYYTPYGKKLLVDYKGKIYYPLCDENSEGALASIIKSYDVNSGVIEDALELYASDTIPTCMLMYEGLVMIAVYYVTNPDGGDSCANVVICVPEKYTIDRPLVIGDGDVSESLQVVKSDPIFSENYSSNNVVPAYNEYPLVTALKGQKNAALKYCRRNEFYSELNNVDALNNINLKELLDQLCILTQSTLRVSGKNTMVVEGKETAGRSNKFIEFK